jgi:hypothetical protein
MDTKNALIADNQAIKAAYKWNGTSNFGLQGQNIA